MKAEIEQFRSRVARGEQIDDDYDCEEYAVTKEEVLNDGAVVVVTCKPKPPRGFPHDMICGLVKRDGKWLVASRAGVTPAETKEATMLIRAKVAPPKGPISPAEIQKQFLEVWADVHGPNGEKGLKWKFDRLTILDVKSTPDRVDVKVEFKFLRPVPAEPTIPGVGGRKSADLPFFYGGDAWRIDAESARNAISAL